MKRFLRSIGACLGAFVLLAAPTLADEQFIPSLVYRTGPYGTFGEPYANGVADYYTLVNERDGGVNGVRLAWEECDTKNDDRRGVACYERLKSKGVAAVSPPSTGIAEALLERTEADGIPMLTMSYGPSAAADGRVFPYAFSMPATAWSEASAIVRYIAQQEGDALTGLETLKGKTIALVYHDSPFGREPVPLLQKLAEARGFTLARYPVAPPGLEQKVIWQRITGEARPDWVLLWGWGFMNAVALKEASSVGFPVDRVIGSFWSGSEQDVLPVGDAALGYRAANVVGLGADDRLFDDIRKFVYDQGKGAGDEDLVGEVLYDRGLAAAVVTVEAIRAAQAIHGNRALAGAEVRDGFEALDIDRYRVQDLGIEGFLRPLKFGCADHKGGGAVYIQQWNSVGWEKVSDWIPPMTDAVRPMIEDAAAAYAGKKGIEPRACPTS
ncbi:MAG: ABC transporter substrate-binding protein [Geminicoccaceae bacterium]|nr:ABC transporter substrate-binding protein [Geminicoccaceae bacterium]